MTVQTFSVLVQQVVKVSLDTDRLPDTVARLAGDFPAGAEPQQVAERLARARAEHDDELLGVFTTLGGLCVEPGPVQAEICGDR